MRKDNLRKLIIVAFSLLILACADHAPAPVIDINNSKNVVAYSSKNSNHASRRDQNNKIRSKRHKLPAIHKVMPGETLYSIAWRYSLDYLTLARLNNIKLNRIYPGQILTLKNRKLENQTKELFRPQSLIAAINSEVLNKTVNPNAADSRKSNSNKSNKLSQRSRNQTDKNNTKRIKPVQNLAMSSSKDRVKRWMWPVNGKVISHFSKLTNQNKGLDIAGVKGTAVRATAKGKVVYSGSGLRGYGRLIIIKHNDSYLSAYAHNEKLLVGQDEFVKAGQRIANLGSSGANREKLHFEIRYKGRPVDPLNYLPKTGRM